MSGKKIRARVKVALHIDGVHYKPNRVIEGDVSLLGAYVKSGQLDDTKEAVAFCLENEGGEVIVHKSAEQLLAEAEAETAVDSEAEAE